MESERAIKASKYLRNSEQGHCGTLKQLIVSYRSHIVFDIENRRVEIRCGTTMHFAIY